MEIQASFARFTLDWLTDGNDKGDKPADAPAIDAMLLAKDRLFVAGSKGDLRVLSSADGKPIARQSLPAPLWDGMAVAQGRLYYCTRDGQLLCLGE